MKKKRHIKYKQMKFEILYQKYANDVYKLSLHLSKDEEKAKNITLRAFEELYKSLEEVEAANVFPYLVQKIKDYANDVIS